MEPAGVGERAERKEEEIGYGVFCEYGNGEYKAENRIGIEEVKARGDNEYIGVGVLGKVERERDKISNK